MKILVFSDSHGSPKTMLHAAEMHKDAKMFIFLGDGLRDVEYLSEKYPHIPLVAVRGNCDFFGNDYLFEQTPCVEGIRIFCTHGHKYNAKSTLMNLLYRAKEKEAALCLYGHTHIQSENVWDDVRLFNPGSAGSGEFGIVYIENGAICVSAAKI